MKKNRLLMFIPLLLLCLLYGTVNAQLTPVHFKINEPCNVRISNTVGMHFKPDSTYTWTFDGKKFPDFSCDGSFTINLPEGIYNYELDRGPEYYVTKGTFSVTSSKAINLKLKVIRMVNMKRYHWWSGELHIHRDTSNIGLLMRASDIHIAPVITSWNNNYPFNKAEKNTDFSIRQLNDSRFYSVTGSEDERSGGAILVLNTPAPLDFSKAASREYPALAASVEMARKKYKEMAWIDLEKPFWLDVPILLATQQINSIEIAHNHMNKDGVYDNEAWGKARDREKYPAPKGNGLWTQHLYYQVLNTGLRIPPSAGSASGVLLNPVGYNRVYAFTDDTLSYTNWFESVRHGSTFVTNGPMLICNANKKLPGTVFKSGKGFKLNIQASVYSRDTIEAIEIIKNGIVIKSIPVKTLKNNAFASEISFDQSGWFLVRVMDKSASNFRFASTAPFYVEVGDQKKFISRSAAQFFLDWVNERSDKLSVNDPDKKASIDIYINIARKFWEDVVNKSTHD